VSTGAASDTTLGKTIFYRTARTPTLSQRPASRARRLRRRSAQFSTSTAAQPPAMSACSLVSAGDNGRPTGTAA
jgi:hypothetical protein